METVVETTTWSARARSVCAAITHADPLHSDSAELVNMLLSSMLGLVTIPNCPRAYHDQAGQIIMDCSWGDVARETHLMLAQQIPDEGEIHRATVAYYE